MKLAFKAARTRGASGWFVVWVAMIVGAWTVIWVLTLADYTPW